MNYADEYTWLRFLENLQEAQRRKALRMETNGESKGTPKGSARLHWFDNERQGERDVLSVPQVNSQVGEKGVGNA
jgi:hypothetical protein